jgi:stearoyl-CoA desaturase (delta-9 desaturase)
VPAQISQANQPTPQWAQPKALPKILANPQLAEQNTKAQQNTQQNTQLEWGTLMFFVVFHGFALLAPWFFSWSALGVCLVLHWLCGSIGICLAYHRLLTHRSFEVPRWLEYVLVTIGTLALQGGPIFWVSGHRLHHAHTEDPKQDPYASSLGFWWSHVLWLIYKRPEFFDYQQYKRYAKDLDRDPYYRWLNRYFLIPQVVLALVLFGLGGWSFVVYGIFLRAVLVWHTTWFINSATHLFGYRNFDCEDDSRNLWWAAILAYGEGWHNNHHADPRVAQAGLRWWEIDMTWWVIRLLEGVGLARKVVRPKTL